MNTFTLHEITDIIIHNDEHYLLITTDNKILSVTIDTEIFENNKSHHNISTFEIHENNTLTYITFTNIDVYKSFAGWVDYYAK